MGRMIALFAILLGGGLLTKSKKGDPNFIPDDVPVTGNWDANLVNSVLDDLSSTLLTRLLDASPRCTALERYYKIPENEFKVVHNLFKNSNKTTIRAAINNTNTDGCGFLSIEWSDKVIERLDKLGL